MYRCTFPKIPFIAIVLLLLCSCNVRSPSDIASEKRQKNPIYQQKIASQQDYDAQILNVASPRFAAKNSPLSVDAGVKQRSDANLLLVLSGTVQSLDGSAIVQTRWLQTEGPEAILLTPEASQSLVLLPDVTQTTLLRFRLAAVDANNFVQSDETTVLLLPVTAPLKVIANGVSEAQNTLTFTIQLAQPAATTTTFAYTTLEQTARAGVDFEAASGNITFQVGESRQTVTINLIGDDFREGAELFGLRVGGVLDGENIAMTSLGAIVDAQIGPIVLSSPAVNQGPSDLTQGELTGNTGLVRMSLRWSGSSDLSLMVRDPCLNVLHEQRVQASCQETLGSFTAAQGDLSTPHDENIFWSNGAPEGLYDIQLQHRAGPPAAYELRIFYGEESQLFTGTISNGDQLPISQISVEDIQSSPESEPYFIGIITDAVNAQTIAYAHLTLRSTIDGPVVFETDTDAEGKFTISLAAGHYYVQVQAEGFIDSVTEITLANETVLERRLSLSPVFDLQLARIILQWGESPRDLDSHLTGPTGDGGSFHVFYSNKTIPAGIVQLDTDETTGFGPETISITQFEQGFYRYSVLDYVNKDTRNSFALAQSGANVTLILADGTQQIFEVPNQAGVLWSVFEIDGSTGEIIILNTLHEPGEGSYASEAQETITPPPTGD